MGGPVLLLHGFSEDAGQWRGQISTLARAGLRAVAFDQRGYSPGVRPLDVAAYGPEELIGDVLAVAAALGWERFDLVGHDWGSAVAWMTAVAHPLRPTARAPGSLVDATFRPVTGPDDEDDEFAIDDAELDAWLEEWDEAERHAAGVVIAALAEHRGDAPPAGALAATGAQVRAGLARDDFPLTWVKRAAGLSESPPEDDAQLLLALIAATISPQEETGLPAEEEAALAALELGDWAGAVIELARAGPGTNADPASLVQAVERCPEIEGPPGGPEDASVGEFAFALAGFAWEASGVLDRDLRLTPLGAWALPRALTRAWGVDFDSGQPITR
jgi:pimeloyl-ACP methyl ester carboxylesterase